MLQKFRAAFTSWNERIKHEYVIKTTDEELYQVSQVLLIKERVVILETDQYRECVLEKKTCPCEPSLCKTLWLPIICPSLCFYYEQTLKLEANQ